MTNARDKANIPVLNFSSKGIDDNASATAITIDSSERIGIGTASPTSKLSIEANSPDIMFTDTSGGTDSKKWRVYGLDDNFNIGCRNDANNSGQTGYTILRTGATISNHRFSTNGSERMRIENNGLVRIKNTSHTNSLISGNHNLVIGDESSGASGLAILAPTNDNSYVSFFDSGNSGSFRGSINYNHNTDSFRFYVSGSERMRLFSGGNVSIGTTSDPTKLAVSKGNSGVSPHNLGDELFIENNGDTGFTIGSSTSGTGNIFFGDSGDPNRGRIRYHHNGDYMEFGTAGGNEKLVITSAGNVGIGVSNPDRPLVVDGGSHSTVLRVQNNSPHYADLIANTSGVTLRTVGSYPLILNTNQTERMRINSSGLVMAGTTSPINLGHTFKAIADSSQYFALSAEDHATGDAAIRGILSFASGNNGSSGTGYLYVGRTSDGDKFHVRSDGDVNNTNNSYGSISDRNLKENEVDASSQWNDIKAIQVKNYNLKSLPDKTHLGVIAQDLEASGMNGLVKTDEDGTKSVKYSILYMKSVKALQEAMTRIETLEAEITALKNQP